MNWRFVCVLAAWVPALLAQSPRVALLEVELSNMVSYRMDVSDPAMLASTGRLVDSIPNRGFLGFVGIADVVAVNGKPAKGLWSNRGEILKPAPSPGPNLAIANVLSDDHIECTIDLFTADGTWVGKLADRGLTGTGSIGPTHPVLGGAGAFLGVVGEHGWVTWSTPMRRTSAQEDPSVRQILGGGKVLVRYYLVPKQWPEVEVTAAGPSVYHADGLPVTASSPARAGEVLIMRAKGLGPTRPTLMPAGFKPFGQEPYEEVNSPVEVTVGGKEAEVINKIGWPGSYDLYRVDFRVPATDGAPGMVALRLTAAWIAGPEVRISVQ
ncbi:MAG: hypothetical protein HUU41_02705 [Bryobacteraceae bacterium]|nr:hypothetical protein [Bryobacterales bacterium]NUM99999.1 hypothetical protein [Bryobacteraceae bacterium]